MPNRLADETSPYLLQHQNNPVDWYPWGTEALARAKAEDRPIFLSIGYSACHWCHVMEHESFENAQIAELMNKHYVCVKVDREERPDLDAIYMQAVQLLTRRGGWPMSVFLTPELQPFFGGTYWPPAPRHGMPGFDQVLLAVNEAWTQRRKQALDQATEITEYLRASTTGEEGATPPVEFSPATIARAADALVRSFDNIHGGFGGAPKFPHPMDIRLLLRAYAREPLASTLHAVTHTLDKMAAGGIYDHLGGGFHRYSVDERWLVPHFEKMLYDNAQLIVCYVEAFQATGRADFARIAGETCDYVLREMTDGAGGFYSTEDADSEGEEGIFYVWTPDELQRVLGTERGSLFASIYDVTPGGNFEGRSILNLPRSIADWATRLGRDEAELRNELLEMRQELFTARATRVRPGLDDKVLISWNGMMIDALALAGAVLAEPRYVDAARKCAEFLWTNMRRDDGRLLHSWRGGQAKLDAYLDDYAAFADGLVTLYEATGETLHIERVLELVATIQKHFTDPAGGFFFTADDHEQLLVRHKDLQDNAVPSGNSLAASLFVRLAKLTGRADLYDAALGVFRSGASLIERYPSAAGRLLTAYDFALGPTPEYALVGGTLATERPLLSAWLPRRTLTLVRDGAAIPPGLKELYAGKSAIDEQPTLYVCENFTCATPVVGEAKILEELRRLVLGPRL